MVISPMLPKRLLTSAEWQASRLDFPPCRKRYGNGCCCGFSPQFPCHLSMPSCGMFSASIRKQSAFILFYVSTYYNFFRRKKQEIFREHNSSLPNRPDRELRCVLFSFRFLFLLEVSTDVTRQTQGLQTRQL